MLRNAYYLKQVLLRTLFLCIVVLPWGLAQEIIDLSKDLVVMLSGELQAEPTIGSGIAFGVRDNRLYIVTANHVVRRGETEIENLKVEFRFLPGEAFEANLLRPLNTDLDLAVLTVNLIDIDTPASRFLFDYLEPAPVSPSDVLYSVGYGSGIPWLSLRTNANIISENNGTIRLQFSDISQGDSGGAIFNQEGQFIGLIARDNPPAIEVIKASALKDVLESARFPYAVSDQAVPSEPVEEQTQPDSEDAPVTAPSTPEKQLGTLRLTVFPSSATVTLNGEIYPSTEAAELEAGSYTIVASLAGYESQTMKVTIEPDRLSSETIQLVKVVTFVTANSDWTPREQDFNGTTMVMVPAGEFVMGSTQAEAQAANQICNTEKQDGDCPKEWFDDEIDGGKQTFSEPFWLDKTEVTRAAYEQCVSAGKCERTPDSQYSASPNQPINRVTWYQAAAYCSWRDARLPTEAEWEYAARGPDGLRYPWGNSMTGNEANHCDSNCANSSWAADYTFTNPNHNDGYAETSAVGSYPQGQSWVGALDMAGNVWEWTRTKNLAYPYSETGSRNLSGDESLVSDSIILRGGSFVSSSGNLRSAGRSWDSAGLDYLSFGFRCARSSSGF